MKCTFSKTGEMRPGHATVTLQRANTVVVIKAVPAQVCQDCGEYYLDEPVAHASTRRPMPPRSGMRRSRWCSMRRRWGRYWAENIPSVPNGTYISFL